MPETTSTPEAVTVTARATSPHEWQDIRDRTRAQARPATDSPVHDGGCRRIRAYGEARTTAHGTTRHGTPERSVPQHTTEHSTTQHSTTHRRSNQPAEGDRWSRQRSRTPRHG
jgi:hypothetical protein